MSVQGAPATAAKAKRFYPRLCAEASSLSTAPARLELLSQRDRPVGPLALRNPSLPTARLAAALRAGRAAAWDNPCAVFVLPGMPWADVRMGAVSCACELAKGRKDGAPYPVSDTMRGLLRQPMIDAWYKPVSDKLFFQNRPFVMMMDDLARYALYCGALSPAHRQSTLLFCLLLRHILRVPSASRVPSLELVSRIESLTWAEASQDELRALEGHVAGLSISVPIAALVAHARVPLLPDWAGCGVGQVWRQVPNACADLLRAALPEPLWLNELEENS